MKKILIIVVVFIVLTGGVWFFVSMYVKNIKANIALTEQLSPVLIEQFKEMDADDFPYTLAEIEWEGKYLLLENSPTELGNGWVNIRYNKALNEKLNTDRFFPGNDINGLVLQKLSYRKVGEYSIIEGIFSDTEIENGRDALQYCYVLFYLDLKQNVALARDTVWGEMPPVKISQNDGPKVKYPKEEDVITAIRNRVK